MKKNFTAVLLLFFCAAIYKDANAQFQYISPLPGAKYVTPESNIILHFSNELNGVYVIDNHRYTVKGSKSGKHAVEVKLLEHGTTIILQPLQKFAEGEKVTVNVGEGIKSVSGLKISPSTFSFQVRPHYTDGERQLMSEQLQRVYREEDGEQEQRGPEPGSDTPGGLPEFTISTNTNPTSGDIFFSHFDIFTGGGDTHYCIINNNGDSVYGKADTVTFNNFFLNKNGYLTAYNRIDSAFAMFDSNYYQIAEYQMGNGYKSDVHEFQINPDGTHWVLAYDPQIVDMTVYSSSYCNHATVIGCVVQKLDKDNNVLFEWRSWDHYSILDADHISFSNCLIDYVHANTIEIDNDGNILLCCRNMSEITKINAVTGAIMWRLGGLNNQFTFINDADGISYQHDIKRIANGNITLYDNGNFHTTPVSKAKEYTLDEVNKKATLVWSYKRTIDTKDVYAKAMGSVQRLSNGNTFICWGLVIGQQAAPSITEVTSSGTVVWEMDLTGNFSAHAIYRAHRRDWTPCSRPTAALIKVKKITSVSAKVDWENGTGADSYDVQYKKLTQNKWRIKHTSLTKKKLSNLDPNTAYMYQVRTRCSDNEVSGWTPLDTFTTLQARESQVVAEQPMFDLYPNPATTSIYVTPNFETNQDLLIEIYDMEGKKIISSISEAGEELQINVAKFTSGIYVVRMITPERQLTQKFVKQ